MSGKKKRRKSGMDTGLLLPASGLIMLAALGYMIFSGYLTSPRKAAPPPRIQPQTETHKAVVPPPVPEGLIAPPSPPGRKPAPVYKARVAIIMDDLGSDLSALDEILELNYPISIAVLPGAVNTGKTAREAVGSGRDVLLHLPMQPQGESTRGLGPGALMAGMDGGTLRKTLRADLAEVPGAVGVNNHMGSLLTEDRVAMSVVMEELGKDGLFFVDSMTSSGSVARAVAGEKGVRSARRNVFLDDADNEADIKFQFDRMVKLSLRDGQAIAIGHPRPATLAVLKRELPGLKGKGIEVVGVSKLVE